MSEINNPHDRFFKELLSQRANARDFLRYYLPHEIVAEFDLRKIELVSDEFVDEELNQHLADLLYRVKLKRGEDAFVFVLFEHKSSPEKFVAFQIFRYIVRLWDKFSRQGIQCFPVIYPIVLYHGRRTWRVPRNLRAIVDIKTDSPFLNFVPDFEYYLIDLAELKEEDLHGTPYLRAGLLVLKYIFDRELEKHLPAVFQALKAQPPQSLIEHFKTVSIYLSKVKNAVEPEQLKQAIKVVFQEEGDLQMADFFQEWINQGLQVGMQQGLQQGVQQGQTEMTLALLEVKVGKLSKSVQNQIKKLPSKEVMELGIALLGFSSKKDLQTWMSQHVKAN